MCAQSRSWFDVRRKKTWDGKLGIWPIGEWVAAKRNSALRKKGTLEWKNKNVDAETYFDLLTEKTIPPIIKMWPIGEWSNPKFSVTIQKDGAPAHTTKAFGKGLHSGRKKWYWAD